MTKKQRAPRNRTIFVLPEERQALRSRLASAVDVSNDSLDRTLLGDCREIAPLLPRGFANLLFLDPPYNLDKRFGDHKFGKRSVDDYTAWLGEVLDVLLPTLTVHGTVYVCGDWFTSASIFSAASARLRVRNRITWEREKGRGAKSNWKNASEDIWFCTNSDDYTFNVEAVKLKRRVIAPYRDDEGEPRDWKETSDGNFRYTHPSNLWTDISVPFWSMPENTDHPTQKSEKLLAKLILASTNPGDVVFDPFLGSGTTSVVARKLGRRYLGIESVEEYALLAEKRLRLAATDTTIQGYTDRVFWERNTFQAANARARSTEARSNDSALNAQGTRL
ncbi:MAG: site-specific DNA-methyltransferase [Polyangiaceae bacterium]|nr:site-specific DNA-methyltransferase [Polyangiaceae bacterium]